MRVIPTSPELIREAIIVLGGAIIAAFVIGKVPPLKAWIKAQWGDTPRIT